MNHDTKDSDCCGGNTKATSQEAQQGIGGTLSLQGRGEAVAGGYLEEETTSGIGNP